MKIKIKVACLPVAGKENPFQYLMMKGLNESQEINAFNGVDNRFFGIIKTVIKYKPNYIHFDWITSYYERKNLWITLILLPFFYFQVLFVRYFTKTKLVWTLHNILPHNVSYAWLHQKVRRFFASQVQWIRVFAESSVERASLELKVTNDKFLVIPEGDYITEYPNTISKADARKKLAIDQTKTVLLSLGYIKPYKGLEKLIRLFSKIENKNIELIIAGQSMDTVYTEGLRRIIKLNNEMRIHLVDNFIPVDKLQNFYNAADAVVLPFDKVENSGSAIMAMGFKKVILAPKMGVLEKRLVKQDFLLYDDLLSGLNSIFAINRVELDKIGKQNYLALQEYKWQDFAVAFK